MKLEPGSVVLAATEVATLREKIAEWDRVGRPGGSYWWAANDLATAVRSLLTQASDDERKPAVR